MTLTDPLAHNGWPTRNRLTPEAVRRAEFARAPIGRRGYAEADVERFRARVGEEMARHDAEKAELRGEIDRLRNYFRDLDLNAESGRGRRGRENPGGRDDIARVAAQQAGTLPKPAAVAALEARHPEHPVPSVQAVNALSQAQQAADKHIAQAENYARQLIGSARTQYEQILLEAHQRAEAAAAQAAQAYKQGTAVENRDADNEQLESRMAYLRTFAEVTQVQMRSILDALGGELERLTEVVAPLPQVVDVRRPEVPVKSGRA